MSAPVLHYPWSLGPSGSGDWLAAQKMVQPHVPSLSPLGAAESLSFKLLGWLSAAAAAMPFFTSSLNILLSLFVVS